MNLEIYEKFWLRIVFFTLEYVILIWNDTTNIQIYLFQVGAALSPPIVAVVLTA